MIVSPKQNVFIVAIDAIIIIRLSGKIRWICNISRHFYFNVSDVVRSSLGAVGLVCSLAYHFAVRTGFHSANIIRAS